VDVRLHFDVDSTGNMFVDAMLHIDVVLLTCNSRAFFAVQAVCKTVETRLMAFFLNFLDNNGKNSWDYFCRPGYLLLN